MGKRTNPLDRELFDAALDCHVGEIRRLLGAGTDPNVQRRSLSALGVAAAAGNSRTTTFHDDGTVTVAQHDPRESVAALLAAGADPDRQTRDGWTPLMSACYSAEVTRMLLPNVRHIDRRTKDGRTALSLAAGNGHAEVVELLLAAGASPNVVDEDGRTAFDHAGRFPDTTSLLHAAGGTPALESEEGRAVLARKAEREARHERRSAGRDARWPRPDFREAADGQAYAEARARLRALCGGVASRSLPERVSYALKRGDAVRLVEQHQESFLASGAFLYCCGDALRANEPDAVALLPTTSVYDVIQYEGTTRNHGEGPSDVCEGLAELATLARFSIDRLLGDRIEGRWLQVDDAPKVAAFLARFCSDIVHQGVGSRRALARTTRPGERLYLWWD